MKLCVAIDDFARAIDACAGALVYERSDNQAQRAGVSGHVSGDRVHAARGVESESTKGDVREWQADASITGNGDQMWS